MTNKQKKLNQRIRENKRRMKRRSSFIYTKPEKEIDLFLEQKNAIHNKVFDRFKKEGLNVIPTDRKNYDFGAESLTYKLEENKDFLLATWVRNFSNDKPEPFYVDIFGQYEEEIDKFKPTRSAFLIQLTINADLSNLNIIDEIDFDKFLYQPDEYNKFENTKFNYIWKQPELAFCISEGELFEKEYENMSDEQLIEPAKKVYAKYLKKIKESKDYNEKFLKDIKIRMEKTAKELFPGLDNLFVMYKMEGLYNWKAKLYFQVYPNQTKIIKSIFCKTKSLSGVFKSIIKEYEKYTLDNDLKRTYFLPNDVEIWGESKKFFKKMKEA